jgi:hypothetical protein
MAHFAKVTRLAALPPGTGMMVVGPFDKPMALPHREGPLANGRLDGHVVACPWHGWTFDVRTGRPDHPGGHGVAAYEVQVRRRDIYVGWIKA